MGVAVPKDQLETTVVFGDVHGVYYDKKSWQILLQVIDDLKPQRVIINGDFMDCYSISSFIKDPNRGFDIQEEFNQANDLLNQLQRVHKGETIYISGNHENRLKKKLWGEYQDFASMPELTIEGKLCLEERKIQYIQPKGRDAYYMLGKIKVGHFNKASQHSAYTAKSLVDKYACSIIQGHTHRLGEHFKTMGDDTVVGVESGCLCDLNPEYVCDPNWMAGFVIVNKVKGKNRYHIQSVPIVKHEALYNGVLYAA